MLPQSICVECGNIHAQPRCPKCGCKDKEPISDAMQMAILSLRDETRELLDFIRKNANDMRFGRMPKTALGLRVAEFILEASDLLRKHGRLE